MVNNSFARILKAEIALVMLKVEIVFCRVVDRHWRCALRAEEVRYPYRVRYAYNTPSPC